MQSLLNKLQGYEKQIKTESDLHKKEKLLQKERGILIRLASMLKIPIPKI